MIVSDARGARYLSRLSLCRADDNPIPGIYEERKFRTREMICRARDRTRAPRERIASADDGTRARRSHELVNPAPRFGWKNTGGGKGRVGEGPEAKAGAAAAEKRGAATRPGNGGQPLRAFKGKLNLKWNTVLPRAR